MATRRKAILLGMKTTRIACFALLATSCAVVTAVTSGAEVFARWAGGVTRGQGQISNGEQVGQWTYYDDSGQKRAFGAYKNDAQDGPWVYYHPNGNKEHEGTFQNEKRTGIWRYWHANGAPKAQGYFEEGNEFGEWVFWDTRSQLTQRGMFQDGMQVGRWTYVHPNGARQAEGWFFGGTKVGAWEFWSASGERTARNFGLASGMEVVVEKWPDGTTRREGLVSGGRPQGFWVARHRNGQPRMHGAFEGGVCAGPWVAFDAEGGRLAAGMVSGTRPTGDWIHWTSTGRKTWNAAGSSPAMPVFGEWSQASLAASGDLNETVGRWLAETSSAIDRQAAPVVIPTPTPPPTPRQVAEVTREPDVPVKAQPWTNRELKVFKSLVQMYTKLEFDRRALASRYTGRSSNAPEDKEVGGSPETARLFEGRPLPLTEYRNQDGSAIDLSTLKGQRVVLVVLRGFGGGLCVYCTAQTAALCDAGAFERFDKMGVKLYVVFPGAKNGMEAFKRGYEQLGKTAIPPYGLLYQRDAIVGKSLNLEGTKVIPSTFILDEEGVVRFAYIGEHEADRPPVERLFKELEKLGPKQ